jgi:short-subunit dehydrogenase
MSRTPLVILITGASSGIGAELARQLAARGHRIAISARRADRLEALAKELDGKDGAQVMAHPADMTQPSQVAFLVEKVKERFGRIDVLVNNAGVLKMQGFLDMHMGDMQYLINTNFWGPVLAIRAAAPIMVEQGGGHIIQVGSGVSRRGLPFMAVYSASKFALAGLTESLRVEMRAQGIRFTTVYPGGVETEMPASVDVSKLPEGYPRHASMRISAARAARAIRKAIECRPLEVYVPWWVRFTSWISVLCPGLADFLIRRGYKRALDPK